MEQPPLVKSGRDVGLDMAKGIAILLVVLWHAQIIIPRHAALLHAAFAYFYYIVTLVAVPLFFTASLFLFLSRLGTRGVGYFGKRMLRLAEVFVFWGTVQCLIALACGVEWPGLDLSVVMRGGIGLPIVGGSVLYFLFNLLVLTTLAFGLASLPQRLREPLAWGVLAAGLACLAGSHWLGDPLPNYLVSFFGYVPLAYLLRERPGLLARPWLYTGLWLAVGMAEMLVSKFAGIEASGPYARLSTLLGVLAILSQCRAHPVDLPWLRWLSVNSLGIFAMHKYFQGVCFLVLAAWGQDYEVWNIPPGPALFVLAGTLVLTCIAVGVLRRTPLVRYMS